MSKIEDLEIQVAGMGSTRPTDHPNYFIDQFATTITFRTNTYPKFEDRELLQYVLEQYLEISQNLAKQKPVTQFTQVK